MNPEDLDEILDRALKVPQKVTCRSEIGAARLRVALFRRRGRRPLRISMRGVVIRVEQNDPILKVESEGLAG